jgi:ABC-type transport system involved in multi-copper enzyme maturation permease subunit
LQLPPVIGPLFLFDLVRTARRGRHNFMRLLFASLMLTFLYLTYSEWSVYGPMRANRMARFSMQVFSTFALVQFAAVFLLTPAYVAAAITEEKEGKTLEFLLATELHAHEIILGKCLARVANIFLLMLAGFPILCMLELSGGVDPQLVFVTYGVTALSAIALAALSIFCSVHTRTSLNAVLLTYFLVGLYLALSAASLGLLAYPGFSGLVLTGGEDPLHIADLIGWFNAGNLPVALNRLSMSMRGRSAPLALSILLRNYLIFHGTLAALCLGGAIVRLRSATRRQVEGTGRRRRIEVQVRPRVWHQPLLWKEFFVEADLRLRWPAKLGIACFFLLILVPALRSVGMTLDRGMHQFLHALDLQGLNTPGGSIRTRSYQWEELREGMDLWVSVVVAVEICVVLLIMTVRAAGSISGERARHTLDALLTTPLDVRSILLAKALACLKPVRIAWWSLAVVLLLGYGASSFPATALWPLLGASVVYAAYFIALGLWLSTIYPTTTQATLFGLLGAIGTALVPGLPSALIQGWYFHDARGLQDAGPLLELINLFSPPELLRFLLARGPNTLWARFSGGMLALVCCGHLLAYVVATVWLWRAAYRRLRVECQPAATPPAEPVPELPPLTAKEAVA